VNDADAREAPTASSPSLLGPAQTLGGVGGPVVPGIVAGRQLLDRWPEQRSAISGQDFFADDGESVEQWMIRYERAPDASRQILAGMELDDCAPVRTSPMATPAA
jgi:hypothetical protein